MHSMPGPVLTKADPTRAGFPVNIDAMKLLRGGPSIDMLPLFQMLEQRLITRERPSELSKHEPSNCSSTQRLTFHGDQLLEFQPFPVNLGRATLPDIRTEHFTSQLAKPLEDEAHALEYVEGVTPYPFNGVQDATLEEHNWITYNFEVADLHTYVAGGLRVHNASVLDYIPKDAEIIDVTPDASGVLRSAVFVRADGVKVTIRGQDLDNNPSTTERTDEILSIPGKNPLLPGAELVLHRTFDAQQHETDRHIDKLDYGSNVIQGEEIGRILGSALGHAIGGNNIVAQVGISTLSATLLQNLGEFLHKGIDLSVVNLDGSALSSTPLQDAFGLTLSDFHIDLAENLKLQAGNALSSVLVSELAEALHLTGFERGVFTVAGTTVTSQVIGNLTHGQDLLAGFDNGSLLTNLGNSFGSFFGSQLGSLVVTAATPEAALFSSAASAVGSYIGAVALAEIPVVGPFLGAFLGKVLGTFIGDQLFPDHRKSYYDITVDSATHHLADQAGINKDGADPALAKAMADGVVASVNSVLDAIGAHLEGPFTHPNSGDGVGIIGWQVGDSNKVELAGWDYTHYDSYIDPGGGVRYSQQAVKDVIASTTAEFLQDLNIAGGDVYMQRAFYSARSSGLAQLGLDLQVAKDFHTYVENTPVINTLMAQEQGSSFALGWLVTLQRAQELALNKAGHGDFESGLPGFLKGLDLASFGATAADRPTLGDVTVTAAAGGVMFDIALRATTVVPQRVYDLYGGQASVVTLADGSRMLHFNLDAATFARSGFKGTGSEFLGSGWGSTDPDPNGTIWEVRGTGTAPTLWIGHDDRISDYRDRADYWDATKPASNQADILIGGAQRSVIVANDGDDWIQGGAGDDSLYGGAGNDVIVGGGGNDYLVAGTGADTFVFRPGSGYDTIVNFKVNGGDVIQFGMPNLRSFQEIMSYTHVHHDAVTGAVDGTIIEPNPQASIFLAGTDISSLTAANFAVRPAPTVSVANVQVTEGAVPASPNGFLHTSGNQIVDANGTPFHITAVNWFGLEAHDLVPHGLYARTWHDMMDQMKALGFNTIRLPFASQTLDPNSHPVGGPAGGINLFLNQDFLKSGAFDYHLAIENQPAISSLEIMDKIIDYAGKIGLHIILDHHLDEAQTKDEANPNGLWYSLKYDDARWVSDWQMLAQRYAGNPTVIGADLHNEPHTAADGRTATWGTGDIATDWQLAAERAGNAIGAVNPDWLIFVEGIQTYDGVNGWWGGNLMGAAEHPVRLDVPNKLVYAPHDYPSSVSDQPWFHSPDYPNNLPAVFDKMWGYLYKDGIAPVFLGEIGSNLASTSDQAWANKMVAYLKGDLDGNGTVDIPAGQFGPSWAWWSWNPDSGDTGGILNLDWRTPDAAKLALLDPVMTPAGGPIVGSTGLDFTVSLSAPASEVVRVDYHTATNGPRTPGAAVAGGDFAAIAGTVTFAPGEQVKTVHTTVFTDTLPQDTKAFQLVLSNPTNAVFANGAATVTGTATIVDNAGTGNAIHVVQGGDGGEYLVGPGGQHNALHGGTGNDVLIAGPSGDLLSGGAGNDVLYSNTGDDRLYGGAGHDVAVYGVASTAAHLVHLGGSNWTITAPGFGTDTLNGVEVARFTDHDVSLVPVAHDANGDGTADILWRGTGGELALWTLNGTTVTSQPTMTTGVDSSYWSVAGFADATGDGKADVLWRGASGETALWALDGPNVITGASGGVGNGMDPNHWHVAG